MLESEVSILTKCQHPHIVTLYKVRTTAHSRHNGVGLSCHGPAHQRCLCNQLGAAQSQLPRLDRDSTCRVCELQELGLDTHPSG
jgi:hypothetical protein